MGHPGFWLGFKVFGVLDGADLDVGLFAGFVAAESGDPDFAITDHGSLGVDEEVFVLLFEDGVCDVVSDDAVVVLDEGFFIFDKEGFFAWVDLDGIVDQGCDGGCVVTGYGLLELGEDLVDSDVVSDGEVDGFVQRCDWSGGGLSYEDSWRDAYADKKGKACELSSGGHSGSKEFQGLSRG